MDKLRMPLHILLAGNHKELIASVAVSLLQSGSKLMICSENNADFANLVNHLFSENNNGIYQTHHHIPFEICEDLSAANACDLAIILTTEDTAVKSCYIKQMDKILEGHKIIACNTESIHLDVLQMGTRHPERVIGANWADPVYTTMFLEIIRNEKSSDKHVRYLTHIAVSYLGKDPYIVSLGYSVRSRLFCAIIREAFFLIDNGYATPEDIDRAFRNDAGFYLPFAGNFRYMDLMGLYAYGLVMKDLNPELSKETVPPDFLLKMESLEQIGMKSGKGFYTYSDGEARHWRYWFKKFSGEIEKIQKKYPLITEEETAGKNS